MKRYFNFLTMMSLLTMGLFAQTTKDSIAVNPKDVESAEAAVAALYDVISGPAGTKRNWARMRSLFIPEAKLIPTGIKGDGVAVKKIMSVEEYINGSGPFLEKEGFFEKEIGRKTEYFGNIAHIFSTYESRKNANDEKPFMRGINSIQLWNDGKRWWIVNIIWQNEDKENPIPGRYIQG